MKQTLKWTGLILLAGVVGLGLAVLFTAGAQVQSPVALAQSTTAQATPFPSDRLWSYGPGMMGGWPGYGSTGVYTPTQTLPYSGNGPGMMRGWNTDWRGSRGPGMMGGYGIWSWSNPGNKTPLTIDQATEAARQYLSAYGNPDLALTEVMEFSDNFYAEVEEKSTSVHAFELLVDRYSGAVYPEPGPNMMWNTKYGHMGGGRMMGGGWRSWQADPLSVTPETALDLAQEWLDQYLPGTSVAEKADAFYGYYTIHTLKDGQVAGMLSVNGYTGEVWYHTWHGDFVGMKELEQ